MSTSSHVSQRDSGRQQEIERQRRERRERRQRQREEQRQVRETWLARRAQEKLAQMARQEEEEDTMRKLIAVLTVIVTLSGSQLAEGGLLFHAARRSAAKRILSRGFSPWKMRSSARFGKGIYLSRSLKTVAKEKSSARAFVAVKPGRALKSRLLDLRKPRPERLRALVGPRVNLRGAVRRGVIGPKMGKRVGAVASSRGKALLYQSAKDPRGTNVFIPRRLYQKHPRIVWPQKARRIQ